MDNANRAGEVLAVDRVPRAPCRFAPHMTTSHVFAPAPDSVNDRTRPVRAPNPPLSPITLLPPPPHPTPQTHTFMVSRAVLLSPMRRICCGLGPMNSRPWSLQISTNSARSDRKP